MRHRRRLHLIAIAASFAVVSAARAACGPTREKYRDLEFGDVRVAVEEDCRRPFTQEEQFFLAGVAQHLQSTCALPRDRHDRDLVQQFAKAAALSLEVQHRQTLRSEGVSHSERASAFQAGTSMMDEIRCQGPEAALLARGLVIYLKRTAGRSRFVPGCIEFYAPRYGQAECRCIAETLGPVLPDIDQHFFDKELIRESIHRSPRVAVTLLVSCGVSEY